MQYFILLTSDSNKYANEILEQRLKSKVWEIYDKTNLRNQLEEKSKVIFYLAGSGPNLNILLGRQL